MADQEHKKSRPLYIANYIRAKSDTDHRQDGEEHFTVTVEVKVSEQFFAWMCGFGLQAKIITPERLASEYKEYLSSIVNQY